MPLIERLLVEHLEEEPLAVFKDEVWQKLLENRVVFDAQQAQCRDTFKAVEWSGEMFTRALPFLRCPHCSSPLVRCVEPENMAFDNLWTECAECGEEIERETLFEKAFDKVNDQEAYFFRERRRNAFGHKLSDLRPEVMESLGSQMRLFQRGSVDLRYLRNRV